MNTSFYESMRDAAGVIRIKNVRRLACPPHFHSCVEFIYVESGCLRFSVNGEYHDIVEGQMMAAASFVPHGTETITDGRYYLLILPRDVLREYDALLDGNVFKSCIYSDDDDHTALVLIRMMFNMMYGTGVFSEDFTGRESSRRETVRQLALALLNLVICRCGLKPENNITTLVAEAVKYIDRHYREELHVSDIARILLTNQQKLSQEFSLNMNIGISGYISRVRITAAERLLLNNPDMTLVEVAEQSGYRSIRSFLRCFKSEYGCAPTEYKKKRLEYYKNNEIRG